MPAFTLAVPETFARLGRQLTSTALTNARRSTARLARSNADRQALRPTSGVEADRPGDLRRLDREECLHLLTTRRLGRYAYVASARALDVVPVNYLSRPDGSILFRTGPGPKLSAADRRDVVAFEVDDIDELRHTGWSVLVVGRARRLDPGNLDTSACLQHPWAAGPRHSVVLITPTRIEGRRLI